MFSFKKTSSVKILSVCILGALLFICFPSFAAKTDAEDLLTVHVKAGGDGDGSSAESAFSDISSAFEALGDEGGIITVHGKYELAASSLHNKDLEAFVEPEHSGKITVVGSDAFLVCKENYRYYASGDTTFENIGISGSGTLLIAARYNKLCMGEGINIVGCSDGVYLIGGFNGSNSGLYEEALAGDTYIEVRSGNYKYICGYNKGTAGKDCSGEANIVISGGSVNCVSAGISNMNSAFTGNSMNKLNISISGGEVYKICETDTDSYGTLSELTLDVSGGSISHIIIHDSLYASLSYSENMIDGIREFLKYFDTYKEGDGELTETEKIKVACIGDSITSPLRADGEADISYPAKLAGLLGDAYEVGNFGEGGATMLSSGGSAYINTQKHKDSLAFLPDVVFIMLGTNDLSALISDVSQREAFRADTISLLQSYLSLESKPVIYLLSPTQRTDDRELDLAIKDILIPLLNGISKETQVGYIDIYEISRSIKDKFPDAIHPNESAASFIASWLYSSVVSNSNISTLNPNSTHVELTITEPTLPPANQSPATDVAKKNSDMPLVLSMILLIVAEAGYLTYLSVSRKKKGSPVGTDISDKADPEAKQ